MAYKIYTHKPNAMQIHVVAIQFCTTQRTSFPLLSLVAFFSLHVPENAFESDRIMSLITWQVVRNLPRQLQKSKISTAALNNCACFNVQSNPCIISLVEMCTTEQ